VSDTLSAKRLDSEGSDPSIATRSMWAIGTTAVVAVTAAARADEALALLADDLRALDAACSRFRSDSEIRLVERSSGGRAVTISPLLFDALEVACVIAAQTAGIVDPTIGSALIELGYDRDFDEISTGDRPAAGRPQPAPGWWQIQLDPGARTVVVPAGVHIDLGATAKAFAADRAAERIAAALECGVLVNLGGDVAVAGPCPKDGWAIGIAPECTTPLEAVDQVVTVCSGGLATSGTTARSWVRNGRTVHHIIDPWTGEAAPAVWSLVSTMAPSCVEANAWSTAAVVWGHDAVGNLAALGMPARLVSSRGDVVHLGDWPLDAVGHSGRQEGGDDSPDMPRRGMVR
jgi:thiamine biosynthesis lipoprotein